MQKGQRVLTSPIASLHLPDFVLVTLYYPMGEQGPQTPMACLTPATLMPVTALAPADHHNARLPQAAPAFLRELPSAHKRVWTPLSKNLVSMHLAIKMCNFYLWNAMTVLHSDCFECHRNGKGFTVATRASTYLSVCFIFPSTLPVFYK